MKKLLLLILLCFSGILYAQNADTLENVPVDSLDHSYIDVLTDGPEFPGGVAALYKFISDNLKYPTDALESKIEGRVIVQFIVEKNGAISNIVVIRGIYPSLDAEAIRVVSLMPKWQPNKMGNVFIRDRMTLPISFKLPVNNNSTTSVPQDTTIYDKVDKDPMFPGGEMEMYKFLAEKMIYPEEAVKENIQGKVILRFVVEKDGSITNIEVIRSLEKDCDIEAIRVVKLMPKWIPGEKDGNMVRVRMVLAITFFMSNVPEY